MKRSARQPKGQPTEKSATSVAFRPNSCAGSSCTGIRALVLSVDNIDPIADGAQLFTCHVASSSDFPASGFSHYRFSEVILSDPVGRRVPDTGNQDGTVCCCHIGASGIGFGSPETTPAMPVVGDLVELRFNTFVEESNPQFAVRGAELLLEPRGSGARWVGCLSKHRTLVDSAVSSATGAA